MSKKFCKFLFVICILMSVVLSCSVDALKFKISIMNELDKTRITLKEISDVKPRSKILRWSHLVDDKDIFVLNNRVVDIPNDGYVIEAIKRLEKILNIPTSYIEDHYDEILDQEENDCDVIYKYVRDNMVVKNILNKKLNSKNNIEELIAKRRKICVTN